MLMRQGVGYLFITCVTNIPMTASRANVLLHAVLLIGCALDYGVASAQLYADMTGIAAHEDLNDSIYRHPRHILQPLALYPLIYRLSHTRS